VLPIIGQALVKTSYTVIWAL